jgi:pimeloyl-ACP methyl ester carboxylesterase
VELTWEIPAQARFFKRLSSLGRLILFDKRGTGMSDRVAGVPTLENRMDDIRAVMDTADSERAVLIGRLWAENGVASLERSKRSWEEDVRTARLGKQPAGTLAAYWLASGPAGFLHMPRNG